LLANFTVGKTVTSKNDKMSIKLTTVEIKTNQVYLF